MRKLIFFFNIFLQVTLSAQQEHEVTHVPQQQLVFAQDDEIYVYADLKLCPFIEKLPELKQQMIDRAISCEHLVQWCDLIVQEKKIVPLFIVEDALSEVIHYLSDNQTITAEHSEFLNEVDEYYKKIESGITALESDDANLMFRSKPKKICSLKVGNLLANCLKVKKNLTVCGQLTIKGSITAGSGGSGSSSLSGCQPGPLTIGTSDATSLNLVTQCTNRLVIDSNGGATINTPAGGETGLTINGGGEIISAGNLTVSTGNIILPVANAGGTQGLFELGVTGGTTRFNLYEVGTRNFFAGNGVNAAVTGTDNISIGTSANSTLTTANNTIAIGNTATATATDSLVIGDGANTAVARAIVIGSKDSTSTGVAPTASGTNAIAIGSASGANAGAIVSGVGGIAIGGADGATFAGASAGGSSIGIGVAPTAGPTGSILIGSASGTAGGTGPTSVERNAIGIGSAQSAQRAVNPGNISAICIGGSDGVSPGAAAAGVRSIGIGLNANTAGTNAIGAIILGSTSGTAGTSPTGSGTNSIAIGSANGGLSGARSTAASAVAFGGSDGTSAGASTTVGARCVAIGTGAAVASADLIVLGNVASTAVRVGIGTATPAAKLDVVGVNGTPIVTLNQVTNAIGNAPRWDNPATSAVAGTPIHYNASNQLFGFTSSLRYKTNVRPLITESDIIYKLNPVLYNAKDGDGSNIPGFIAEDVYAVVPSLAILNNNNEPETIAYNSLHALAIKEIQKHQQQLAECTIFIQNQANILDMLLAETMQLQKRMHLYSNKKISRHEYLIL